MTEVELSRLFSALSDTAAKLNAESDSVNGLIEQFQEKLRSFNVGLEVWLDDPIRGDEQTVRYGDERVPGSVETYLGFAKDDAEGWTLQVRQEHLRRTGFDVYGRPEWESVWTTDPTTLLSASRADRIAALEAFPKLLEKLTEQAHAALTTIERAKKLVS